MFIGNYMKFGVTVLVDGLLDIMWTLLTLTIEKYGILVKFYALSSRWFCGRRLDKWCECDNVKPLDTLL